MRREQSEWLFAFDNFSVRVEVSLNFKQGQCLFKEGEQQARWHLVLVVVGVDEA